MSLNMVIWELGNHKISFPPTRTGLRDTCVQCSSLSNSLPDKMSQGVKRGSPGDHKTKSIQEGTVLTDEDAKKLQVIQRETARIELAIGSWISLSPWALNVNIDSKVTCYRTRGTIETTPCPPKTPRGAEVYPGVLACRLDATVAPRVPSAADCRSNCVVLSNRRLGRKGSPRTPLLQARIRMSDLFVSRSVVSRQLTRCLLCLCVILFIAFQREPVFHKQGAHEGVQVCCATCCC